jgi:hypothetical protein
MLIGKLNNEPNKQRVLITRLDAPSEVPAAIAGML